jgi:error-prone DNA polymerase
VAIIRPGPIVGQMVNPYLQRRQGREPVTYPHPSLEPVLKRTLGVPLFQEQLLRIAMVAANFSGGEAEDLRRAMGFKRSQARMKEIEAKLRSGMTQNGISQEAQEQIVLSISSFALYGFPESHAASFALIAYASAYLKCHYLAAFTAALLNNQPMGFYRPATLVKDAQRHGLKVLPIDVMKSEWQCTLEQSAVSTQHSDSSVVGRWSSVVGQTARNQKLEAGNSSVALRLGLRYARGLREEAGQALVHQRALSPFTSIRDLIYRVPELRKDELNTLAEIGALNSVSSLQFPVQLGQRPTTDDQRPNWKLHRRDALWQVERAVRHSGPLLDCLPEPDVKSPLSPMNAEERLVADFRGTGMTVGPHPMAYHRARMTAMGIHKAIDLKQLPSGRHLRIGGCVIARQRPGTAKGFVFLSLEDETGVANAIVTPNLFQQNRLLLSSEQFLMVEGILQNQDNVISVKAQRVSSLDITRAQTSSHDFY